VPTRIGLTFLVLALAGCTVERLPISESPPPRHSPAISSSPSPIASLSTTPEPPVVVDGERVDVDTTVVAASNTVDGVRVLIEANRNPMPAGEPTWVTTTLFNRGPGVLRWMTDGCATHVGVRGQMSGMRWAAGGVQEGAAQTFKSWADRTVVDLAGPISLGFVPERFVDRGDYACGDVGVTHELEVGGRTVARHRWDGLTGEFGLPPSGPAEVTATFDYWWRDGEPEGSGPDVAARLPVVINRGRGPAELSPGQVIDVALSVPQFRALLEAHPSLQEWDMPIRVEFDSKAEAWEVELRILGGAAATVTIGPFGEVRNVDSRG
jgi:hypothetical protein